MTEHTCGNCPLFGIKSNMECPVMDGREESPNEYNWKISKECLPRRRWREAEEEKQELINYVRSCAVITNIGPDNETVFMVADIPVRVIKLAGLDKSLLIKKQEAGK